MRLLVILALTMTLVLSSTSSAQENQLLDVHFSDAKQQRYTITADTRLADILRSIQQLANNPDWQATRLGSSQLQYQLERLQLQTEQRLQQLVDYAVAEQQSELAYTVRQIQRQLNNSQFLASYYMGIPFDGVRLKLENNPKLYDTHGSEVFNLRLNQRPISVDVFGATDQPQRLRLASAADNNSVVSVVEEQQPAASAEQSYVWRISLNGDVAHQPIAAFNQRQLAKCFKHRREQPLRLFASQDCEAAEQLSGGEILYIGLDEQRLPEQFAGTNRLIVRLLKHYAVGARLP